MAASPKAEITKKYIYVGISPTLGFLISLGLSKTLGMGRGKAYRKP
jgi:hypothetical protein